MRYDAARKSWPTWAFQYGSNDTWLEILEDAGHDYQAAMARRWGLQCGLTEAWFEITEDVWHEI